MPGLVGACLTRRKVRMTMARKRGDDEQTEGTGPDSTANSAHGGELESATVHDVVRFLGQPQASAAESSAAERRRHERVPWQRHEDGPVTLEVEEPGQPWRPVECTIVDLGVGGAGVLAAEPLEAGSRVRITFRLPAALDDLTAEQLPFIAAPDALPGIDPSDERLDAISWSALAEIVHGRHTPERVHGHVPDDAHRPHHRGMRFNDLDSHAEMNLLRTLYGPLPAGWAVERYLVRRPVRATRSAQTGSTDGNPSEMERFAVLRNGKRLVGGFATYDRARSRAWSMQMDERAEHGRQRTS